MVRKTIGRWLPSRAAIEANPSLRWMSPAFSRPWLWQLNRRGVATGAAVGVFFGLLVPVVQIPLAVAAAWLLRCNLPVAVAGTLVSNPLTYVPIWLLAHETGQWVLGQEPAAAAAPAAWEWSEVGFALATGLSIFAVGGALLAYCVVHGGWLGAVWIRALRRHGRRNGGMQKS